MDDTFLLDEAPSTPSPTRTRAEADALVLELVTGQAESLLRLALRHSSCADDAHDAYQRTMEQLVRHAHRIDADRAPGWLHTIVKREAWAVRRSRQRDVALEDGALEALEERTSPSPEERALSFERVARAAEALSRVKPDEARAIWLKAAGDSYREIGERTGWSYTKVNRCLAEGRKSFLEHYEGIEAGHACSDWEDVLSAIVDGEAAADAVVGARRHLRHCPACRVTLRRLRMAHSSMAVLAPVAGAGAASERVRGTGALGRAWEVAAGFVQDRLTGAGVRVQAVVETATNHKVAAAASAVAVAGGGVAAETAVRSDDAPSGRGARVAAAEHREPQRRSAASRPPQTRAPVTGSPIVLRQPTSPVRGEPRPVVRATKPAPKRKQVSADRQTERRPRATTGPAAQSGTTTRARATAPPPPAEPLVDPVETPAPPTPATPTRPTPAPSRPKTPDPTGEFGFEAP